MSVKIYFDQSSVTAATSALEGIKGGLPRATARALNDTFPGVRTDMVRLIRGNYNHKATAIRARISINKATAASPAGMVMSKGRAMHLTDIATTTQTTKGVTVNVKKITGRKLIPSAFITTGRTSGKKIVFRRVERAGRMVGRYPIEAKYAPHPEIIYNTRENWDRLQDQAKVRLDNNFAHEVDAILNGYTR